MEPNEILIEELFVQHYSHHYRPLECAHNVERFIKDLNGSRPEIEVKILVVSKPKPAFPRHGVGSWDVHVAAVARGRVYDFDFQQPRSLTLDQYLKQAFKQEPHLYLVSATLFLKTLNQLLALRTIGLTENMPFEAFLPGEPMTTEEILESGNT